MIHDFPPADDNPSATIETQEQLAAYLWRNDDIRTLHLEYYQDTHLPRLPESLRELIPSDCPNLEALPAIPRTIHTMKISRCPALSSLPSMPTELKMLILSELNSLEELTRIPPGLLVLHVERCKRLSLIDNFGNALTKLWISKCPQFRSLPPLFDNLIDIAVFDCPIEELPALPLDLRSIRLHGCNKLHAKFKLSPYVAFVHITNCPFVTRK